MAPRPPTSRVSRTQTTRPSSSSLEHPYNTPHKSNKAPTKRLKRADRHATLLNRITKSASSSKVSKRRRPSKKSITNLEGLGDALPEVANGKTSAAGKGDGREEEGKIKHKSLKSQPGANKKKEKLVAMEMERFAKNMALMSAGSAKMDSFRNGAGDGQDVVGLEGGRKVEGVKGGTADRWAAVRGLISQTMERRVDGEGGVGN